MRRGRVEAHDRFMTDSLRHYAGSHSTTELLIELGRDREAVVAATNAVKGPAAMSLKLTESTTATDVDIDAIKQKQQATWASGDYAVIGTSLQIVGESLCETLDLPAGSTVLDVAAGNGNVSLAAARRGCDVTCTDYVEDLLEGARRRAEADGLAGRLHTRLADAEALPFEDDSFDAVVSTFGVMFCPDPARAAAEMLRVCRPGGRIGLANWTPGGFVGQMFKVIGGHVPPPPGVPSPLQWGTPERLEELLGSGARIEATPKHFVFRFRSAAEYFETFKTYYGPTVRAWAALDDAGKESLRRELIALADEHNRSTEGALAVPSEYLEIVAHRTD